MEIVSARDVSALSGAIWAMLTQYVSPIFGQREVASVVSIIAAALAIGLSLIARRLASGLSVMPNL